MAAVRAIADRLVSPGDLGDDDVAALLALQRRLERRGPPERPAPGRGLRRRHLSPFFPDLVYDADGDGLRGSVTFAPIFEGAGGMAHGGFIAAVFDHALGAVAFALAVSRTASMTVEYRRPVPVAREVGLSARVARVEGRKLWVEGRIGEADRPYAEASGLWVAVDAY